MASKPELQINTSLKNIGTLVKLLLASLGALTAGGAGSLAMQKAQGYGADARIEQLEKACQGYDVRLATTETRMQAFGESLVDIKKDLAEIRSTNTQILFILQKDR